MAARTSSPPLNVSERPSIPLTSPLQHGSGSGSGNNGPGNGVGGGGLARYDRRRREDDTLYVILGAVVGAVLIGVLVTLFICARQQHKQRLLLGNVPTMIMSE